MKHSRNQPVKIMKIRRANKRGEKKMHVQIVGMGIVGKAQASVMQKLGHSVTGCDVKPGTWNNIPIYEKPVKDADLTFLCPPEKAVPGVLENLVRSKVHNPYVIKSTVPPGTTQAAILKHGVHICHNPEFLREETFIEDALNQKFVIIGECCKEHGDQLVELYKPMGVKIIRTRPTTSEMAKIVLNNYLSTLITFWNSIHEICATLNLDTKEVAELVKNDERISEYGTEFFGKPFGGKCLPKDLNQLLNFCHSKGMTPKLFETIKEINTELEVLANFRPDPPRKDLQSAGVTGGNK
jgi:UDPglucose 6-dehydrogenase